jgi:hypothetical protein
VVGVHVFRLIRRGPHGPQGTVRAAGRGGAVDNAGRGRPTGRGGSREGRFEHPVGHERLGSTTGLDNL